jgi:hypothetical protein
MVNRIVVWNANGVKEKINDLTLLATTKRPKIIAITETHLSPDHDTTPFKIHDYNLLSFPSTKPSAGIIIYVHYSLHTTHRTDLSTPPNSDLTSAVQTIQFHRKLSNHRSEPTLLAITYIHPNSEARERNKIIALFDSIDQTRQTAIITGDLNSRHTLWDRSNNANGIAIMHWIDLHPFTVLNVLHCHLQPTHNQSVLDIALTNDPSLIHRMSISDQFLHSDHEPIHLTLSGTTPLNNEPEQPHSFWDMENADWTAYNVELSSRLTATSKSIAENPHSGPQRIDCLIEGTTHSIVMARSVSTTLVHHTHSSDRWLNDPRIATAAHIVRSTKHAKNHSPTVSTKQAFNESVSALRTIITTAKREKQENFIKTAMESSENAWKLLKKLKPKSQVKPTQIKDPNTGIPPNSSKQSIDHLAEYFSSRVFSNELSANDSYVETEYRSNTDRPHIWFTRSDARAAVTRLPNKTAAGSDTIAAPLLKQASDHLMDIIALAANLSIHYGHYPSMWRTNRAVGLFKKGDKSDPANFRIITISSVISRTIERMIYPRLIQQLDDGFLHPFQSGFTQKRSVNDNLFVLTESVKTGMNKCGKTKGFPVAFLDISKAFDSVDHRRLIDKCRFAGISEQYCRWIASYLSNRAFFLQQNGLQSATKPAKFGVPQGSIISPLLFLIFINDIDRHKLWSSNVTILLFADDICVFPNPQKIKPKQWTQSLNNALNRISEWASSNLITFSTNKSAAIWFSSLRNESYDVSVPDKLQIGSIRLEWVDNYKYLGLTFDRHLQWNSHYTALLKSLHIAAATINRTIIPRVTPQPSTVITFVRSVLLSIATYGIVFWAHSISKRCITRINSILANPLRRTLCLPFNANTTSILVECGIPSFEPLRSVTSIRFIHGFMHKLAPPPIQRFYNSLPYNQPSTTARKRLYIKETVINYSDALNWETTEPDPPPLKLATIITHQTLQTANVLFKSVKSSHSMSLYLITDPPEIAATRANLRSGHRLNEWRKQNGITDSDQCTHCKQTESTDHVISDCPAYLTARNTVTQSLHHSAINFSTASILGDDGQSIESQRACLKLSIPLIISISTNRHI